MTSLMMRKSIGVKEQKPTNLKKVTKIPASSMPKPQSDASRTQFWGFGIAKVDGVMERIALPKLPLTTLEIFMHQPPHPGLMRLLMLFLQG